MHGNRSTRKDRRFRHSKIPTALYLQSSMQPVNISTRHGGLPKPTFIARPQRSSRKSFVVRAQTAGYVAPSGRTGATELQALERYSEVGAGHYARSRGAHLIKGTSYPCHDFGMPERVVTNHKYTSVVMHTPSDTSLTPPHLPLATGCARHCAHAGCAERGEAQGCHSRSQHPRRHHGQRCWLWQVQSKSFESRRVQCPALGIPSNLKLQPSPQ